MNELGIVLVVVFILVLVFTVFNRNIKNLMAGKKDKSDNQANQATGSKAEPKAVNQPADNAPTQISESKVNQLALNPETNPSVVLTKQSDPMNSENSSELKESEALNEHGGKHFILEVDDPNMTGEKEANEFPAVHELPKFGRPESIVEEAIADKSPALIKEPIESAPEPKAFVLIIKVKQTPVTLHKVHSVMRGLGAKLNPKQIYKYSAKNTLPDGYVTIANLLEPGTFQVDIDSDTNTVGVVLILELPTFIAASAAMHDMIMLARKLSQHLDALILDEKMQPIKESYLQSMREQSLEYDSKKIVSM